MLKGFCDTPERRKAIEDIRQGKKKKMQSLVDSDFSQKG